MTSYQHGMRHNLILAGLCKEAIWHTLVWGKLMELHSQM